MISAPGVPTVVVTDADSRIERTHIEGGPMRGFHCVDPSHDRIEFTGADDEDLFQNIKQHTAQAHPQLLQSGGVLLIPLGLPSLQPQGAELLF